MGSRSRILVDNGSDVILDLPNPVAVDGLLYQVKKIANTHKVTVSDLASGANIEGGENIELAADEFGYLSVMSYSGNWMIMGLSGNASI